jgi:hypothetical protein
VRHIIRYGRAGENLQSHAVETQLLSSNTSRFRVFPSLWGGERQIEQLSCKTASHHISVGRASDHDAMIIDVAVHALKSWDGQVALAEEVSILHARRHSRATSPFDFVGSLLQRLRALSNDRIAGKNSPTRRSTPWLFKSAKLVR